MLWLYQLGQDILPRVPRRLVYWVSDLIALGIYVWQRQLRATLLDHGRMIAPKRASWQRPLMAWRTLSYALRNYVDLLTIKDTTQAQLEARYEYTGIEYLELAQERGAIVVVPHLGSWISILALLAGLGHKIVLVVEPIEPPELLAFVSELRAAHGLEIAPLGPQAGRLILRSLKQGKIVVLAGDRDLSAQTITLPFFNQPTTLPSGPGRLAARHIPVITGFTAWAPNGRHIARLDWLGVFTAQPDETQAQLAKRASSAITTQLECYIRSFPTSWAVLQPVWKRNQGSSM